MPKNNNNNNFETCPTCGHKKRINKYACVYGPENKQEEEEQKEKEIYNV